MIIIFVYLKYYKIKNTGQVIVLQINFHISFSILNLRNLVKQLS